MMSEPAAAPRLSIRQRVSGDEILIAARGALTRWTALRLRQMLATIVDEAWDVARAPIVVLDLRRLTRTDDDAVTVLDDAAEEFAAIGGYMATILNRGP